MTLRIKNLREKWNHFCFWLYINLGKYFSAYTSVFISPALAKIQWYLWQLSICFDERQFFPLPHQYSLPKACWKMLTIVVIEKHSPQWKHDCCTPCSGISGVKYFVLSCYDTVFLHHALLQSQNCIRLDLFLKKDQIYFRWVTFYTGNQCKQWAQEEREFYIKLAYCRRIILKNSSSWFVARKFNVR